MLIQKDSIKCESIFTDDMKHRVYWKRVWNKDKPLVCLIMINPCISDNIVADSTTNLVTNNVARLENYGGVIIVNLFSILTNKLHMRWSREIDINDYDNDNYIKKAADEAEIIVLAWGKGAELNARIKNRSEQVLRLLKKHKDKLRVISDGNRSGIHPLTPSCRAKWTLEPFEYNENVLVTSESEKQECDPT